MQQAMSKFKYEGVIYDIKDAEARQDLAECVNNGYYDSNAKKIILRHDLDIIVQIDATDFIKDGMVSNVQIINGYLVITFNTDSGQEPISIPITDIFNPDNYYTKSATNALLLLKQDVIQDLAQIRQGAEAGASAYQKPQGGIPKTDMSDDVKESLNKANNAAPKTEVEDNYARKDGYYETLGAGTANNIKANSSTDREIMFDTSGGQNDIASGAASIGVIKGNTVKLNQLINNGNNIISGTCSTTVYYTSMRSSGNKLPQSHKIYIALDVDCSQVQNFNQISYNVSASGHQNYIIGSTNIQKGRISLIITPSYDNSDIRFFCSKTAVDGNADPYSTKNFNIIDLTAIYSAGNEPTSVEQFEADYQRWFGKPLTYEPYDEGSLRNVKMSAIKTTGFNQCDEIFENGSIDVENGEKIPTPDTPTLRTKNFQRVLPNTEYYFPSFGAYIRIAFYDANKVFISGVRRKRGVVTTPSNAAYMMYSPEIYGTTYNHDICINLSLSGYRNGEYEPYWESIKNLPVTQLTGKLNGQGESVVIFPDGMRKAGSAFDEIKVENGVTKAIKRLGKVDLGEQTWAWLTENIYTTSTIPNIKYVLSNQEIGNAICSKYPIRQGKGLSSNDKYCAVDTFAFSVSDSSYQNSASIKSGLSGVELVYELETPQVYVLDDDVLPLMYKVDDFGTEEVLPACTDEAPCCAPTLSVKYAVNAADQLRRMPQSYISKASFDNFLNLVNSALVSVLGGTISVNPTQTNDAYTFAFSEVSNMVVFVSNGSQITEVIGNFPQASYIDNGKAKFYLKHDNALIPLSVAYTGSITAVGVYSPYGSNDTYTVRFSGAYSTSIIGATVNVEQIN